MVRIFFLVAPNNGEGNTTDKLKQYICSIPKTYMSEKIIRKGVINEVA